MAASTPSRCFRSESDCTHSQTRSQASCRVGLASLPSSFTLALTMTEKFVIQGGEPLRGEISAAGNKNAALPILAACLLTDEEILLQNVPRIRDTEAQLAILERLGVKVEWSAPNELRLQADAVSETSPDEELSRGSAPRSCSRGRCSPASARPACHRQAATSSAAPARPAPRRLPRHGSADRGFALD